MQHGKQASPIVTGFCLLAAGIALLVLPRRIAGVGPLPGSSVLAWVTLTGGSLQILGGLWRAWTAGELEARWQAAKAALSALARSAPGGRWPLNGSSSTIKRGLATLLSDSRAAWQRGARPGSSAVARARCGLAPYSTAVVLAFRQNPPLAASLMAATILAAMNYIVFLAAAGAYAGLAVWFSTLGFAVSISPFISKRERTIPAATFCVVVAATLLAAAYETVS